MWRPVGTWNCAYQQKEELLAAKTAEITQLQEEIAKLKIVNATNTLVMKPPVHDVSPESQQDTESVHGGSSVSDGSKSSRWGQAPPVDPYYGNDPEKLN